MPDTGNHPVRDAMVTRINDPISGGTESRTSDAPRRTRASTPRPLPVATPHGIPIAVDTISAQMARSAVLAARARTSALTGC